MSTHAPLAAFSNEMKIQRGLDLLGCASVNFCSLVGVWSDCTNYNAPLTKRPAIRRRERQAMFRWISLATKRSEMRSRSAWRRRFVWKTTTTSWMRSQHASQMHSEPRIQIKHVNQHKQRRQNKK
jgi:hypothetical protein